MNSTTRVLLPLALAATLVASGCARPKPVTTPSPAPQAAPSAESTQATTTAQAATPPAAVKPEAPIAPETNPPGDIPDTQVFVAYRPPSAGFEVKVPEGWSRTQGGSTASFTDKLNVVTMTWGTAPSAPTAASVKSADLPKLSAEVPAFQLQSVKQVKLPAGETVLLTYRQNGEPNAVTGKRYRLDVSRYVYFRNGIRVDLVLSSPVGADNVDPWRTISESLRWL
ncbi:MAG TPA: hypothetical protein VGK50_01315 [Coriobacteriia bacterium]|jgi:hypothetical protein